MVVYGIRQRRYCYHRFARECILLVYLHPLQIFQKVRLLTLFVSFGEFIIKTLSSPSSYTFLNGVGFTTAFGDYYLKEPHEEYISIISTLWEKISMTKFAIQFLCDNGESSYEDMLEFIENVTPPDRVKPFTEDGFLRHAQFIVDQVRAASVWLECVRFTDPLTFKLAHSSSPIHVFLPDCFVRRSRGR